MLQNVTALLVAYLLGSIPSAYIISRLSRGLDIRQLGLGNVGAANVFREIGRRYGIIVWAADVIKGAASIGIALALDVSQPWVLGAGFAALVGHNYPVYIGFRGGKGAATFMGIFLVLAPETMIITFALLSIPFILTRRIIIAIGAVAPVFLVLIWLFEKSLVMVLYSFALILFMGLRSRSGPRETRSMLAEEDDTVADGYEGDNQLNPRS